MKVALLPQLLNPLLAYQLLCTHKLLGESKELHSFLFTNKLFPLFIPHALISSKAFLMPAFSSVPIEEDLPLVSK